MWFSCKWRKCTLCAHLFSRVEKASPSRASGASACSSWRMDGHDYVSAQDDNLPSAWMPRMQSPRPVAGAQAAGGSGGGSGSGSGSGGFLGRLRSTAHGIGQDVQRRVNDVQQRLSAHGSTNSSAGGAYGDAHRQSVPVTDEDAALAWALQASLQESQAAHTQSGSHPAPQHPTPHQPAPHQPAHLPNQAMSEPSPFAAQTGAQAVARPVAQPVAQAVAEAVAQPMATADADDEALAWALRESLRCALPQQTSAPSPQLSRAVQHEQQCDGSSERTLIKGREPALIDLESEITAHPVMAQPLTWEEEFADFARVEAAARAAAAADAQMGEVLQVAAVGEARAVSGLLESVEGATAEAEAVRKREAIEMKALTRGRVKGLVPMI